MINYPQLQRLASKTGVPEEIIEKDYLIELVLFYLARDKYLQDRLVFRGGTALKKVYFPSFRFSEDLDFLIEHKEHLAEVEHKLSQHLAKISAHYPFQLNQRAEHSRDRFQFFILYDLIPEIKTVKELKIDVLKDSFIPAFRKKKVLFSYQEFKQEQSYLATYNLESIAADKIGRILDVVNEPRDLYDLWYLLKLTINTQKIQKGYKAKYGYNIYVPNLLAEIAKEDYRRNWQIRLEKQIPNLPGYELIIEELKKLIKIKLKSKPALE